MKTIANSRMTAETRYRLVLVLDAGPLGVQEVPILDPDGKNAWPQKPTLQGQNPYGRHNSAEATVAHVIQREVKRYQLVNVLAEVLRIEVTRVITETITRVYEKTDEPLTPRR